MQRNFKVKDKGLKIKDASRSRIGIAVAAFNADITRKLLAGALEALRVNGVRKEHITIVHVPGSFELPLACQRLAKSKKYHALIALGCVIKGETDHYYYIAAEAARGIMQVMLKFTIPIGFGVLTTGTLKQAKARASGKNNKGAEAARAVLEMITRLENWIKT